MSIANETNSVVRKLPESAEAEADGTVLYRQRYIIGTHSFTHRFETSVDAMAKDHRQSDHFFSSNAPFALVLSSLCFLVGAAR